VKIGDLSSLTESLMSAVDNLAQYAEVQRVTVALVFDGRPIKARYISTTGEWEVAL
jgi:predicted RNA-binding protein with PIN domain